MLVYALSCLIGVALLHFLELTVRSRYRYANHPPLRAGYGYQFTVVCLNEQAASPTGRQES
jgi:hypothetical protein